MREDITHKEHSLNTITAHGLTSDEYKLIKKIINRNPNITELGIFSAMWNEHCSYKSSRRHLKKLHTKGDQVIQGPGEMLALLILKMMMQLYLR